MSSVMIKCPKTGRAVSTAIEVEASTFRRLPKIAARMYCPVCREEHVWFTGSSWLDGEPRLVAECREVEAA